MLGRASGFLILITNKVHMPGLNTRVEEVPGPGAYEPKGSIKGIFHI